MVLPEQKAAVVHEEIKLSFTDILNSHEYASFIHVWKDNPELLQIVSTITEQLVQVREGTLKEEELDTYLEKIFDGQYGFTLIEDKRFQGNAIHSLRTIVAGKPLTLRDSYVRGVSDKSGKK